MMEHLALPKRLAQASVFLAAMVAMLLSQHTHSFVFNIHSNSPKLTSFYSASGSINPSAGAASSTQLRLSEAEESANPQTFREAEILGLKLMQNGNYQGAIKVFKNGLRLPGAKYDVVRSKRLQGPSPVGGSFGGTESQSIQSLDEFELQAAHYNMACAHAQLGQVEDAIACLETALQQGFDNFSTILGDPDLEVIQKEAGFVKLMSQYNKNDDNKKGFFGLFGKS
ncbi:hypothetical protein MPSEU_000533000 [Mayamaea pseudoterrestris]|nr:hypothetical protein MPSEU_000533000 [Mayamaea pseudoterrestris]